MREFEVTHSLSDRDLTFIVAYLLAQEGGGIGGNVLKKVKIILRLHGSAFVAELRNRDDLLEYISEAKDIVENNVRYTREDFSSFDLYPKSNSVLVDGKKLNFISVEFEIFRLLVDQSPSAINADFVERAVDYLQSFNSDHLEVHISGIKRKLSERGIEQIVEEKNGGYRIVPLSEI